MRALIRRKAVRISVWVSALFLILGSVSCNWGVPEYTLSVVVEEGVTGTPDTGQYVYEELTKVDYLYEPIDPLHTVEVLLNDIVRKTGEGNIVMFGDAYELKARLVDVRGIWKITMSFDDQSVTPPEPFNITLTGGNLTSGPFTDERGYNGTWTAESNQLVLAYWDWEFFVLSGMSVYGFETETGFFSGGGLIGTWTAERQDDAIFLK